MNIVRVLLLYCPTCV